MKTDSQLGVVGGVNIPPQPSPAQPFSLVSITSKKSNCCYEVLHSTNLITDLSAVARSALLRLEASLVGCAERSAWCGFTRTAAFKARCYAYADRTSEQAAITDSKE